MSCILGDALMPLCAHWFQHWATVTFVCPICMWDNCIICPPGHMQTHNATPIKLHQELIMLSNVYMRHPPCLAIRCASSVNQTIYIPITSGCLTSFVTECISLHNQGVVLADDLPENPLHKTLSQIHSKMLSPWAYDLQETEK